MESANLVQHGKLTQTFSSTMNIPRNRLLDFGYNYTFGPRCWNWMGTKTKHSYGIFKVNGKQWRAHRLMWIIDNKRSIPKGLYIIHTCDNPSCVNPSHLKLGTADDNLKDCISKGRFKVASGDFHGLRLHPERRARGDKHGTHTHPESVTRGNNIAWAKLNDISVNNIREEYTYGKTSFSKLARKYNVSIRAISAVIHGETWKHILDKPKIRSDKTWPFRGPV